METTAASFVAKAGSERAETAVRSTSVVMATYNGAEFLETQLESIRAQTRAPGELVVSDDGSDDGTVEIVERFARDVPFEVRLIRNEQRLGFGGNFMNGARHARGDVIAWSDQDDVWMPDKLARCVQEFEHDDEVLLVVHSTEIVDGAGTPRVAGPLARYRSRRSELRLLGGQSTYQPASLPLEVNSWGHSCLVSRRVIELGETLEATLPGVFEEFSGHDTWTLFLATAAGKVVLLPDALVRYRQHRTQVAGAGTQRTLAAQVTHSAGRTSSRVVGGIEERATRAFFRAAVLTELAALLETEAGLGRDARQFRARLDAQVAGGQQVGFGRGALDRAVMWRRHGEILGRRLELWRQQSAVKAAAHLVRNAASRDYGRADRGGLGSKLLARDLWRIAQVAGRRPA